jgi:hypothetical protein
MNSFLRFALVAGLFSTITVVTAVTFAQLGESSSGKDSRQDGPAPGVSAMCAIEVPDCDDMVVGGDGSDGEDARCAADAAEDCDAIDLPIDLPVECSTDEPCAPPAPVDGPSVSYDIIVPFTTSVTDDDLELANEVVLAFDPNADFLLQESFPPTGRATLTSADPGLCVAIEAKLAGIPSVGEVTCAPGGEPAVPNPDEPVSNEPGAAPGDDSSPGEPDAPPAPDAR